MSASSSTSFSAGLEVAMASEGGSAIAADGSQGSESETLGSIRKGWTQVTAESAFFAEEETTQFQSGGLAITADGRQINFNVNIEMSRSFEAAHESIKKQKYFEVCDRYVGFYSFRTVTVW